MNGGTEMDVSGKQSSEKRLIDYYYLAEKIECPGEPLVYWHDIEAAPTVDAVPVVRCRECIAYTPVDDNTGKCVFLIGKHQYVVPDGYCYLGERKEGAD